MFNSRLFILLMLFIGIPFQSICAKPNGSQIGSTISDTSLVNMLNQQCWSLRRTDPSFAISIGKKSLSIAKNIGYNKGEAQALNFLGNCYIRLEDHKTASSYFFRALSFSDSLNIAVEKGYALNNIAGSMLRLQEYRQGLRYALEALKLQTQNKDKKGIAYAWMQVSDTYYYLHQFDSLLISAQNALVLFKEIGMQEHTMVAMKNIGRGYEGKKLYNQALNCDMEIVSSTASSLETKLGVYLDIVKIYNQLKQPDDAIYWAKKWLESRSGYDGVLNELAESYSMKEDWKEAFRYAQLSRLVKDSLLKEERFRQLENLQILYATRETIKENENLKERINTKNLFIVSFIVILILIGLLLMILLSKRKQQVHLLNILNQKNEEISNQRDHLNDLNQTKDRLFSIIAHDLRGPIGNTSVFLDLLTENESDFTKEELITNLNMLKDSTNATFKLLENLLTWALAQKGEIIFNPKTNNLYKLVESNFDLFASIAENKKISLLNEIDNNLAYEFDFEMINTVMRNLINNALKYTGENGQIIISAKIIGEEIEISVHDTGLGMDNNTLKMLFSNNNFKPNRQEGTKGEKGTGLGLILCKEFIEKHNGHIWAESEPGKGSTFKFVMPQIFNLSHPTGTDAATTMV